MLFQTLEKKKSSATQLTTHAQPNKYISSGLQRGTSTACQNGFVLEMKNNLKFIKKKTKKKTSRAQLKSYRIENSSLFLFSTIHITFSVKERLGN